MSRIANLTLRTKMLAAFGGVSLLMAGAGAFVLFQLNAVQNQYGNTSSMPNVQPCMRSS